MESDWSEGWETSKGLTPLLPNISWPSADSSSENRRANNMPKSILQNRKRRKTLALAFPYTNLYIRAYSPWRNISGCKCFRALSSLLSIGARVLHGARDGWIPFARWVSGGTKTLSLMVAILLLLFFFMAQIQRPDIYRCSCSFSIRRLLRLFFSWWNSCLFIRPAFLNGRDGEWGISSFAQNSNGWHRVGLVALIFFFFFIQVFSMCGGEGRGEAARDDYPILIEPLTGDLRISIEKYEILLGLLLFVVMLRGSLICELRWLDRLRCEALTVGLFRFEDFLGLYFHFFCYSGIYMYGDSAMYHDSVVSLSLFSVVYLYLLFCAHFMSCPCFFMLVILEVGRFPLYV